MGVWERYAVPRMVRWACGANPIRRQREKIVPRARGRVLELGIGGGMNLPHYDRDAVTEIVGVDPSEPLLEDARRAAEKLAVPVSLYQTGAEELPLDDASIDSCVVTYTLCSIPDLDRALSEVQRVLVPDGSLLFVEHGLADDPKVQRWQHRLTPYWRRFGGGCHLDRPIPELLERAGFELNDLETIYLPGPRALNFNFWGEARPTGP